jgi:hypothetical protein
MKCAAYLYTIYTRLRNDMHGLSKIMCSIGLVCYVIGLSLHYIGDWLRTSDFFFNLGHAFFPLGVFGYLSGPLKEVNKPEEDKSDMSSRAGE